MMNMLVESPGVFPAVSAVRGSTWFSGFMVEATGPGGGFKLPAETDDAKTNNAKAASAVIRRVNKKIMAFFSLVVNCQLACVRIPDRPARCSSRLHNAAAGN